MKSAACYVGVVVLNAMSFAVLWLGSNGDVDNRRSRRGAVPPPVLSDCDRSVLQLRVGDATDADGRPLDIASATGQILALTLVQFSHLYSGTTSLA